MTNTKWLKLNEDYADAQHYISDLKARIADLEADNQALGASISQARYDSYEQSIRNRELRERAEAAEKITRELSVENAGLRRQLYDANAELERLRAERWEPVIDGDFTLSSGDDVEVSGAHLSLRTIGDNGWESVGVDLDDDIRLCRAVAAPTWSQEPPDAPGDWWVWRSGDRWPVCVNISYVAGDDQHWAVTGDGLGYVLPRNEPMRNRWWCKAVVPQPPEVT